MNDLAIATDRESPPAPPPRLSAALVHWVFALPAIFLVSAIVLVPGLLTIAASLTDWDGVSSPTWAGLANFRALLSDVAFWRGLYNNTQWTILFLTIPMALALTVASMLRSRTRIQSAYQTILLIPYVLSPIVNVSIWSNIVFAPLGGLVGFMSRHFFHLDDPLAQPGAALYAVASIDMWHFYGYLTVIFLGALKQVPDEQIEAATLEGVNGWQLFRWVTLPNIAPTVSLMIVMVTIFSFLTFDYVYLSTSGGPGYSTEVLSVLAYDLAFTSMAVGRAAAVAVVMGLFGLLAAIVYTRFGWASR